MMNISSSSEFLIGPNSANNSFRQCLITRPGSIIYITFIAINVFLFLPLFIFILYYGFRQWRKSHSGSSPSTTSHSDCFTYHLVVMELVGVLGCIVTFSGIYRKELIVVIVGSTLFTLTWYGQGFFHILTCVEHYLAVVHPITYLMLKEKRGIRVRNVTIGCVWLLSLVGMGMAVKENYVFMDSIVMILTVITIAFCSLSVLCALTRPGPGDQGKWKEGADQSKQRAFCTIVAILLVLLLRFVTGIVWKVITLKQHVHCVLMTCEALFNLPSSLVLPLLFLQRAGKLAWCENIRARLMRS